MTAAERIRAGELPATLEGGSVSDYARPNHPPTWDGFIDAISGIMWVRYQAFERDMDAEDAAEDWLE